MGKHYDTLTDYIEALRQEQSGDEPQLGGQTLQTGDEPCLGGGGRIVPSIGYDRLLSMSWDDLDNMTAEEIGQAIHEVEVLMVAEVPTVKDMVVYKLVTGEGDRLTDTMIELRAAFREVVIEFATPMLRLIERLVTHD